jgi:glycogen debranching enzyme GlgX
MERAPTFALFSEHATAVSLCLFDNPSVARERARIPVTETTAHVWHAYLPDVGPGQVYGYRVDGPFDPDQGHWFNPQKLLIDPYARALHGALDWTSPIFASVRGAGAALRRDRRNDAAGVPRAVVIDPAFDWGDDRPPTTPWERTIIYEVHVKGFTKQHPAIPEDLRGTYTGMAHPAAIEHLTRLGVTAVELLPVHAFADEGHLVRRGLRDYWGYNTIGYFAPAGRYAANRERAARSPSSRRWSRRFTPLGSRCCSMSSTTTPPKGITSVRPSHGVDRQHRLLPPRAGPTALLSGLRRHRQHARCPPPAGAAAGDGLAPLLGRGNARRRLPVRPRLGTGAR